jgi:hypothetical protein
MTIRREWRSTLVNGVGIAMVQHVANLAHLDWVIATDDRGSDAAAPIRDRRSGLAV